MHTDKITLLLDNNKAGREATAKITEQLITKCFVKIPEYPAEKEQPEHLSREELQELLGFVSKTDTPPGQEAAAATN